MEQNKIQDENQNGYEIIKVNGTKKTPLQTVRVTVNGEVPTNGISQSKPHPQICPFSKSGSVRLSNVQDSSLDLVDTLHRKAANVKTEKCSSSICSGSMMKRDGVGFNRGRSREEIWSEAKEFLETYYESLPEKLRGNNQLNRLDLVNKSIMDTGSYSQTLSELSFGAQLAWRNAPRCIGRIQWSNLQLFDGRCVTSTGEMFDAICNHIRYGTNRGFIRSAITVFSPLIDDEPVCKIWNSQYILYAGYKQADGTFIGDPINAEFTRVCQKLGWRGMGTHFDILPLVLQWGNDDPVYYSLPEEIILRVPLRHPKFPKFTELKLEWYALPAVSGMFLDCGGIIYPACGFNGWYMSTEIMKDLTDPSRYNRLQEIASSFGLDTQQPPAFWKDTAAVELNVAILYSFQEDGVTIVDQYTASETFMRHMTNESKLRGGCPADWVWINPPISGSLTPVYHQEMLNYQLKPAYCYQDSPHVTHYWKNDEVNKSKLSFRNIARSVKLLAGLMSNALAKRVPCTILYASETGTAEQYAYKLQKLFNQAFNASVQSMADYDYTKMTFESLLIIVASTFGNGEPPENGKLFVEMATEYKSHMSSGDNTNGKLINRSGSLNSSVPDASFNMGKEFMNFLALDVIFTDKTSERRYAVFGLGSSAYPNFCAFAKEADAFLDDLGFTQVLPLRTGDAKKNQDAAFEIWSHEIFNTCIQAFCIAYDNKKNMKSLTQLSQHIPQNYRLVTCEEENEVRASLKAIHRKPVIDMTVKEVQILTKSTSKKEYIRLSFGSEQKLDYHPGDHIALFPCNPVKDVELICQRTEFISDAINSKTPVKLLKISEVDEWTTVHRIPKCSLQTALLTYLDISSPPLQAFLNQLLLCNCIATKHEAERVSQLANDDTKYKSYMTEEYPSFASFLKKFPSITMPASLLLMELPLLRPRFYSVSSSPLTSNSMKADITASILEYTTTTADGTAIKHTGLCTNWMRNLKPGATVRAYMRRSTDFHMPEDDKTPMILIGPGSGIAPYRSFWQHEQKRLAKGGIPREIVLFFGCWSENEMVYKEELDEACSKAAISRYHVAYSRQPGMSKRYVQHDILKYKEEIGDLLADRNAQVFVCGDIQMASDVRKVLNDIAQAKGYSKDMLRLKAEGRYHEDIYGAAMS